jgi:hypothetical protein
MLSFCDRYAADVFGFGLDRCSPRTAFLNWKLSYLEPDLFTVPERVALAQADGKGRSDNPLS